MNDDEIAQLNLFSGLAMHALINRATKMPTVTVYRSQIDSWKPLSSDSSSCHQHASCNAMRSGYVELDKN